MQCHGSRLVSWGEQARFDAATYLLTQALQEEEEEEEEEEEGGGP